LQNSYRRHPCPRMGPGTCLMKDYGGQNYQPTMEFEMKLTKEGL
jgi:hypothetical protein